MELPTKEDSLLETLLGEFEYLGKETQIRLSQYDTFKRFYEGDQWWRGHLADYKGRKFVRNLCRPTVEKYATLLFTEFPKFNVPRKSEIREIKNKDKDFEDEFNQSERIEKELKKIYFEDNAMDEEAFEASEGGSLYGDACFIVVKTGLRQYKINSVFPGHVRPIFQKNNFKELEGWFYVEVRHNDALSRKYPNFKPADWNFSAFANSSLFWDQQHLFQKDYSMVITYVDEANYVVFTNEQILEKKNFKASLYWVPNRRVPYSSFGVSDINDVIPIQEELNIAISDEAKVARKYSTPPLVGTGVTQKDADAIADALVKDMAIPLRKESDLKYLQIGGTPFPLQNRISQIIDSYHKVSALPPVAFGTAQGSIVTGVAMTAQFAPTIQRVRAKWKNWNRVFKEMTAFILKDLEASGYDKETGRTWKEIIGGNYSVEFMPEVTTPRDDSIYINNELQKYNARLQSRTKTMTRLGIESPEDELATIAWEELHPLLKSQEERAKTENQLGNNPVASGAMEAQLPPEVTGRFPGVPAEETYAS